MCTGLYEGLENAGHEVNPTSSSQASQDPRIDSNATMNDDPPSPGQRSDLVRKCPTASKGGKAKVSNSTNKSISSEKAGGYFYESVGGVYYSCEPEDGTALNRCKKGPWLGWRERQDSGLVQSISNWEDTVVEPVLSEYFCCESSCKDIKGHNHRLASNATATCNYNVIENISRAVILPITLKDPASAQCNNGERQEQLRVQEQELSKIHAESVCTKGPEECGKCINVLFWETIIL